jgi:electron transfer flavoprotein beta subunit
MLVVAALRFSDAHPAVAPLTAAVRTDPVAGGPSEADRCALEHALRLSAALGARCLAVTVGPRAAEPMLRDALAAGADEVLRVDAEFDPLADDGSATAAALVAALPRPDLVVCGDHSADRGTGSTPAFLAGLLGAAQALGLLELSIVDGGLRALRRLDGGRRERLAVPLPAVCSVEPTAVRLRRAALPAVLAAARVAVPVRAVAATARLRVGAAAPYRPRPKALAAPTGPDPRLRLLALTGALTDRTPPRVLTPPDPSTAADAVLTHLRPLLAPAAQPAAPPAAAAPTRGDHRVIHPFEDPQGGISR